VVVEDFDPGSGNLQHQHVTPVGGLFHAEVDLYGRVEQGQRLGTVRDLFGEVIYEVKASRAGVLITIRHVARVSAGDALANIAPNAGPPEDEPVLLYWFGPWHLLEVPPSQENRWFLSLVVLHFVVWIVVTYDNVAAVCPVNDMCALCFVCYRLY
jgi:hypothetical protein